MVRKTLKYKEQNKLIDCKTTDLSLASPLDIGSFLKWGLARIVNEKDGRGFITLEQYSEFKVGERS